MPTHGLTPRIHGTINIFVLPLIFTQHRTQQSNAYVDLESIIGHLSDGLSELQPKLRLRPIYLGRSELLATLCSLYWATAWMLANSRNAHHIKDKAPLEALGRCLYSGHLDSHDESLAHQLAIYIEDNFTAQSRRVIVNKLKEQLNGRNPRPGSFTDLMLKWQEEDGPEKVKQEGREEGREEGSRETLLRLAESRVSKEELTRLSAIDDIEELMAEVDKLL